MRVPFSHFPTCEIVDGVALTRIAGPASEEVRNRSPQARMTLKRQETHAQAVLLETRKNKRAEKNAHGYEEKH
jgi:hypothetical protein